jgi:DNA-binding response OmpR family regulator
MPSKILIADDEAHMLRVTELSLRKGSYSLLIARNGVEAVEIAFRELPSLIVLDVQMPELDGLGALRRIRADPRTAEIPVIMLTARGHSLTRVEAEGSGATMFMTKPFSPNQLLADVRRLLATPDAPPSDSN